MASLFSSPGWEQEAVDGGCLPDVEVAGGGQIRKLSAGGPMTLARRIIPCLDVDAGRVVKGIEFRGLRDMGDPAELAARYSREGADELVMLDISASLEGRSTFLETVRAVAAQLNIPLTAGGGIRTPAEAHAVFLAGADKVTVNTAAALRPELISELAGQFGSQAVVLSMDVKRNGNCYQVHVRGGRESTGVDALAWAAEGVGRGAGEILLSAIDRDGTQHVDLSCQNGQSLLNIWPIQP